MNNKVFAIVASAGLVAGLSLGIASKANASDINWNAIANCESSGDWHANTGNGYYGGLQFTLQTWEANGGSGNPANASRSEQIRVAENVVSSQGLSAWPVCGVEAYSHSAQAKKAPQEPQSHTYKHKPVKRSPVSIMVRQTHPCGDWDYTSYIVKSGDTFSKIGRQYNMSWKTIWNDVENKAVFPNPNLIYPGDKVCIPYTKTTADG